MTTHEILFILFYGLTLGASTAYAIVSYTLMVSNKIGENWSAEEYNNAIRRRMTTLKENECDSHVVEKERKTYLKRLNEISKKIK
ncbi:MAG: hypothetical protein K2H41_06870 [Acetatifactor sp.]|nr:hypothetical protein [Acetatifactor sp.]